MRFGSVQFFKVLIKTVLAILFFAPLIVAVILGVFLVNKNQEAEKLRTENISLSTAADVLVGSKAGTAEDLYNIIGRSDINYNDFLALLYKDSKLSAEDLYNTLSEVGVSDRDIISIAASKKNVNGEQFYDIMTKNGITDKDLAVAVINNNSTPEKLRALLKECGLTDADIAEIAGTKPSSSSGGSQADQSSGGSISFNSSGGSSSLPASSSSRSSLSSAVSSSGGGTSPAYRAKYPDMYVDAPTDYVRESNTIYLTFDDGPSNNVYSIIEYILKPRNVKATFFVTPDQNTDTAAKLKYIANNGHAIGIHSASHDYEKIYASVDAFLDDFYKAWTTVYEATGIKTAIFRFPGGSNTRYNESTREDIIAEMTRRGFRFYDWNVQSNDILGHNWSQMYNTILTGVRNSPTGRSIVLFHDRADNGVNVLDDVIKVLQGEGYKFDKINDNTMPIQFVGPFS